MKSVTYKIIEFVIIFLIIPISFAVPYSPWLKLSFGLLGFLYVIYILLRVEQLKLKVSKTIKWKPFWKLTGIKLLLIAFLTTIFVWITDSESLFTVLLNKPLKWLMLLFIYSFFSVYPQELLYRAFFFKRYQSLFKNEPLFLLVNAILFALAHLFFGSVLVLVITFIGGLLFAFTFKKTQSTLLVSIEHAIYGCWLFTVGMGSMLGFPT
ncbi:CPBP family intramembrane metalloprotease [Algibacter amylolyticus]|uniref:CPBP family intramembrane metalloprotease n=1 Tax=Algibacter amylolyticus TaxID=1608400 RepID=A0A5M7B8T5_9FLAO|nr:type II CAAX endopeptidase family protein [Algibacter amylolyticus]KAA5825769.1 CPBP family intramembrane metalloprotease [Algibacter amylolyticus]MBB5267994.1 membrane protease YdiL (CAAX protease family) [Algibacter amylolyticus]TSJ80067.1 CPBP family intramembrane metalloprotease [Algibacter amylolyticus]